MKVKEVIDRVRRIVGDTDANQFTDEHIVAWINDGVRECAISNNLLQKRATSSTVVGQSKYKLPSNILKLHSISYNNSMLNLLTLQEFNKWYSGVGTDTDSNPATPQAGYVWAGELTIYPAPSEVKNIVIDYIADPKQHLIEGVETEELELPVGYHQRIVDYCLAQVAQQDDDLNRYAMKMQEFKTGVQGLQDQDEYTYDLYPTVAVSERDAGDNTGDWY